jgi:chromosome segregation ATPase
LRRGPRREQETVAFPKRTAFLFPLSGLNDMSTTKTPLPAEELKGKRLEEALRARNKLIAELNTAARVESTRRREAQNALLNAQKELKDAQAEIAKLSRRHETANQKIGKLNEEILELKAKLKETMTQPQLQQILEENQRELKHARATISGLTQSAKRLKGDLDRCRREKEEMGLIYKRTIPECEKAAEWLEGLARCIRTCQNLASPTPPESAE